MAPEGGYQSRPDVFSNPIGAPSSPAPKRASEASSASSGAAPKMAFVQMESTGRAAPSSDEVHSAAARGISGGGSAMPHADAIQKSFGGHDISAVQAHTGGAASEANAAMGANAFASGNHVAFRGAPSLFTAAHEAAHVIQQRKGVQLSEGVGASGDAYEQHADAVAQKVVAGESAEGLLSTMGGPAKKG